VAEHLPSKCKDLSSNPQKKVGGGFGQVEETSLRGGSGGVWLVEEKRFININAQYVTIFLSLPVLSLGNLEGCRDPTFLGKDFFLGSSVI
jgi:hypothetical protein